MSKYVWCIAMAILSVPPWLPNVSLGQVDRSSTVSLHEDLIAARHLIKRGDTADAVTKVRAFLSTDGARDPIQRQAALRALLAAYEQLGATQEIVDTVQESDDSLSDQSFRALVRSRAVACLIRLKQYDKAVSLGQAGVEAYAGDADAATLLVSPVQEALYRSGHTSKAIDYGRSVVKDFPGNVAVARAASRSLADILFARGLYDGAYEAYRVVTELVPEALSTNTHYRVQYAICAAHHSKEEIRLTAIPILEKVIRDEPEFRNRVFVYHTLGRLYKAFGDLQRARAYLTLVAEGDHEREAAKALALDARGQIRMIDGLSPVEQPLSRHAEELLEETIEETVEALEAEGQSPGIPREGASLVIATEQEQQSALVSQGPDMWSDRSDSADNSWASWSLWLSVGCCAAGGIGIVAVTILGSRRRRNKGLAQSGIRSDAPAKPPAETGS